MFTKNNITFKKWFLIIHEKELSDRSEDKEEKI